jgi:hypothetical protein
MDAQNGAQAKDADAQAIMRDLAVQSAGLLALAAAIVHAVIGETRIFPRVRIEPERLRRLMWIVWQAMTVAWISLAILLIAAPKLGSEAARDWIIAMSIVTFGFGAIGNAWATRGRFFGWVLLVIVVGLAAMGL